MVCFHLILTSHLRQTEQRGEEDSNHDGHQMASMNCRITTLSITPPILPSVSIPVTFRIKVERSISPSTMEWMMPSQSIKMETDVPHTAYSWLTDEFWVSDTGRALCVGGSYTMIQVYRRTREDVL